MLVSIVSTWWQLSWSFFGPSHKLTCHLVSDNNSIFAGTFSVIHDLIYLIFSILSMFWRSQMLWLWGWKGRELMPDLNKIWQVKLEINFLHPSCWPYESACGSGLCRLSCRISIGGFVLSVDEGRGQGEERSPVQSQGLSICESLTQRQMGCFRPLIKWGQDNYYNSDNVYLTPLGLSPFPTARGPGSSPPKPALVWCSPVNFFRTSSFTDTWPQHI